MLAPSILGTVSGSKKTLITTIGGEQSSVFNVIGGNLVFSSISSSQDSEYYSLAGLRFIVNNSQDSSYYSNSTMTMVASISKSQDSVNVVASRRIFTKDITSYQDSIHSVSPVTKLKDSISSSQDSLKSVSSHILLLDSISYSQSSDHYVNSTMTMVADLIKSQDTDSTASPVNIITDSITASQYSDSQVDQYIRVYDSISASQDSDSTTDYRLLDAKSISEIQDSSYSVNSTMTMVTDISAAQDSSSVVSSLKLLIASISATQDSLESVSPQVTTAYNAASLTGSQYFTMPAPTGSASFDITDYDGVAVSLWFKPTASPTDACIFNFTNPSTTTAQIQCFQSLNGGGSPNQIYFSWYIGNSTQTADAIVTPLTIGTWYHILFTLGNNQTTKAYINGVEQLNNPSIGFGKASNMFFNLGYFNSFNPYFARGDMAFASLHKRYIWPEEAAELYNNGTALVWDAMPSTLKEDCVAFYELANWAGHTSTETVDQTGTRANLTTIGSVTYVPV